MIEPGGAFIGLDPRGHLWFAISGQSADGAIVMANITTHWPDDPDHTACRIGTVERRGPASSALLANFNSPHWNLPTRMLPAKPQSAFPSSKPDPPPLPRSRPRELAARATLA